MLCSAPGDAGPTACGRWAGLNFSSLLLATSQLSSRNRCLGRTYPLRYKPFLPHMVHKVPNSCTFISLLLHMHPSGRKQIFPIKTNHCALIHPSFRSSRCSWVTAGSSPGWLLSCKMLCKTPLQSVEGPGTPKETPLSPGLTCPADKALFQVCITCADPSNSAELGPVKQLCSVSLLRVAGRHKAWGSSKAPLSQFPPKQASGMGCPVPATFPQALPSLSCILLVCRAKLVLESWGIQVRLLSFLCLTCRGPACILQAQQAPLFAGRLLGSRCLISLVFCLS